MKIATLSPDNFKNNGIQTVEKNLLKQINSFPDTEVIHVNPFAFQKDFPFSGTIDNIFRNKIIENRIPENVDKVFVPSQTRLNFNPENVDAEVIVYVHDLFPQTHFFKFEEERSWMYRNFFSWIGNKISNRYMQNLMNADKILTPTNYVKNDILTHTPFKGEVKVVGQGVDNLPLYEEVEVDESNIDLLYVGSTLGRKNPEFLKKTLKLAEESGFNVVTVNHEEVDLPGTNFTDVSDKVLASLYKRSRFYLHPSHVEGFGRPPVEAQRYGTVPLALRNPVNLEVLGEAFFEVRSPEEAVLYLENHRPSQDYREIAKNNAERYGWMETGEKMLEVFQE